MAYNRQSNKYYTTVYWRNEEDYIYCVNRIKALKIYNKANGEPNMSLALSDLARHGKFETHLRVEIQQVRNVQQAMEEKAREDRKE